MSVLLYRDILSVCALVVAWKTEWRAVNRNLAESVVLDCARFIVAKLCPASCLTLFL